MWILRTLYRLTAPKTLGAVGFYPLPAFLRQYFDRLTKIKQIAIYARLVENTSFWKRAPAELACAESVTSILNTLFGFPIITGTYTLLEYLKKRADWIEITSPIDGCIVLAATGTGKPGSVGHVGILSNGRVYSNNSYTGKWDKHYSLLTFKAKYQVELGIMVRYFIPKQP